MTKVNLPKTNQTGANEWADVEANDAALAETINGNLDNENIKANAAIDAGKLASNAKPLTWYTPKVIATEESRTNTAFGTLGTPDEITGVVVPENGLVVATYAAFVKSSVSAAGRVSLFIGANQVPINGEGANALNSATPGTAFGRLSLDESQGVGWREDQNWTSGVTTGRAVRSFTVGELSAGTYNISIQFKASSGSVTAKERKLWVEVHGY